MKTIATHSGVPVADDPLWERTWKVVAEVNERSGDTFSQYECIREFVNAVIAETTARTTPGTATKAGEP